MTLTDEEIRVKVAELMGWKKRSSDQIENRHGYDEWTMEGKTTPEGWSGHYLSDLPWYESSADAALQLCDRMHSEGWIVSHWRVPGNPWIVSFTKKILSGKPIQASAPYLPRAVTLAFLKAHNL